MHSPSPSAKRSLATIGTTQTFQNAPSPPLSYLSTRRPSLPQNGYQAHEDTSSLQPFSSTRNETINESGPSDEGGKFKQNFEIDMAGMVGDSVGNMSISPTSRDIVLAARKGLFIIDLEAPLEIPRFLPQGGTWDVADVQWNPSPSRAEYIVSTSSERMLIWNLLLVNKTSIEFILQAHYRAITDINWHTFDPDVVCSTGIDSWIWAWDIRQPQKPAFGLCAFNAGGTQVKWNRKDGNILASSHLDEVLIWDRRKGSIPVSRVKAHDGKIYGIDWSHSKRNEIITCSLDKTIKIWDTSKFQSPNFEPSQTLQTNRPVWRARDLPFGNGVLSVPQRGESVLELWNYDDSRAPVHTFDGHTDVVKEFVWRARDGGGVGDKAFQLITWSKDKTLRFWAIGRDIIQKAGTPRELKGTSFKPRQRDESVSFRAQPSGTGALPALSAPTGARSILAGVRASPLTPQNNPILLPHQGSAARGTRHESVKERELLPNQAQRFLASGIVDRRDGTMSKGSTKGGRSQMDHATWLSSFKREGIEHSRLSSGSPRPPSSSRRDASDFDSSRRRSSSRGGPEELSRESDSSAILLDEINTAVNKLTPAKVKLERHGLTKHRTCTFGLHGPWGESSAVNVFVRVTFTFPKDYPIAKPPKGAPLVEIERNPLISVRRRAYIQKRLREIRESQRPCLEACLRFLLFGDGGRRGKKISLDSGTSSDEAEQPEVEKGKDFSASLIRDNPNLAEPRSSQGVFGPNGQLVCIFRSLPRLVKAVPQDLSATPALPSRESDGVPRLFRSPLQLSDAVRRLAIAAHDHSYDFLDSRDPEDMESILRIMNNLLSFSQPKQNPSEPARQPENTQNNYSLLPKRLTIVFIKDRSSVVGAHRSLAVDYNFNVDDPIAYCISNANIARRHYRHDHERVLLSLATILRGVDVLGEGTQSSTTSDSKHPGLRYTSLLIEMLHSQLLELKDVQILAMFAVAVLQLDASAIRSEKGRTSLSYTSGSQSSDYFSARKQKSTRMVSPIFVRATHSPISPVTTAVSQSYGSSASSRGSWSSLFNAGTVRHLIGSNQEQVRNKPSPVEKVTITQSENPSLHGKRITFSQKSGIRQDHFANHRLSVSSQITRAQLLCHVDAYAEMLHGWRLLQKRTELYKAVSFLILRRRGMSVSEMLLRAGKPDVFTLFREIIPVVYRVSSPSERHFSYLHCVLSHCSSKMLELTTFQILPFRLWVRMQ
ncbi:hypothetical protein ACEPAH_7534 [Sanghuangporus vaninii]